VSLDPGSLKYRYSHQPTHFNSENKYTNLKGGQENFGGDATQLGDAVHLVADSRVGGRRDSLEAQSRALTVGAAWQTWKKETRAAAAREKNFMAS
jgi:hypothetical protein